MNSPYMGKFRVSQKYKGSNATHDGLDLVGIDSKEVHCVKAGIVEVASNADPKGFGIYVRIREDGTNNKWYYGHLSSVNVKVGQRVNVTDVLGIEGSTGKSTGSHCHIGVRVNGDISRPLDVSQILGIPNVEGGIYDDGYRDVGRDDPGTPTPVPSKQIFLNPGTWNVRNTPNMSGKVIKIITGNTVCGYTEKVNAWYKIDGGYVGSAAVKKEM